MIVSGIRPTGRLHVGHYLGMLRECARLAGPDAPLLLLVADFQVLTDHLPDSRQVPGRAGEIVRDCVAAGLDPARVTYARQSEIPELCELTTYLSFLVPMGRLERNPTLKEELRGRIPNLGFMTYPVSQAADILLFKADRVPVGEDQVPHIELTREIARAFNRTFAPVFPEPQTILSAAPRILGLDGAKMGKSAGNAIYLSDEPDAIRRKLAAAVTDSGRDLRASEEKPGITNLLTIFAALRETPIAQVEREFEGASYSDFKAALADLAIEKLAPFRRPPTVDADALLRRGRDRAREIGARTMAEVRAAVFG